MSIGPADRLALRALVDGALGDGDARRGPGWSIRAREVHVIGLIVEQIAAIAFGATPERNVVLRLRCVELMLDGLRATPSGELPGPTVTDDEFAARWVRRT